MSYKPFGRSCRQANPTTVPFIFVKSVAVQEAALPTAFVYRRALRRFATSIVFTILNLVVCAWMIHWVAGQKVSPALLLLIVPLALTLGNMCRCTVAELGYIGTPLSVANGQTAERVRAQV